MNTMSRAGVQEPSPSNDPTFYPVEDDVGESTLHLFIREVLRPLLQRWISEHLAHVFVGSEQFIYYEQYNPKKCVAPDIYLLEGVEPGASFDSWKVWERGAVPRFALEVVSSDRRKDYELAPAKYDELGVEELIIFDPDYQEARGRVRFQVFRRNERELTCVEATNDDRVLSTVVGCWFRAVGEGADVRLRIAEGANGLRVVPTVEERLAEAEAEITRLRAQSKDG